jgi:hypothetical protein
MKSLARKLEGKRPLRVPKRKWEKSIKIEDSSLLFSSPCFVLHAVPFLASTLTQMIETMCSSESLVDFRWTTHRYNPEDTNKLRPENLSNPTE